MNRFQQHIAGTKLSPTFTGGPVCEKPSLSMESFFSKSAAIAATAGVMADASAAASEEEGEEPKKTKEHRRRRKVRVVTTAYAVVDTQRKLLCGMHAIHNLLQRRVFAFSYSRRHIAIFINALMQLVNAAYILLCDAEARNSCRALELQGMHDIKCCKCQIPVARPRCLRCSKTELDTDSVRETHKAALKAAEEAAAQAISSASGGGAVTRQDLAKVALQVAKAAADRALHEVVRNTDVFSAARQAASSPSSSLSGGAEDSEDGEGGGGGGGGESFQGDFLAACQDAAAPRPMATPDGNISSEGMDRLLDSIGMHNCRRSVRRPSRPFNVRQVTRQVLQEYEEGGFLGLIAFQGEKNHYVAFCYYAASATPGKYVYIDSLPQPEETRRGFMNLGVYSRNEVYRWLKHNCYEVQDGRRQMAYAWVVSQTALPTADAVPDEESGAPAAGKKPMKKKTRSKGDGGGGGDDFDAKLMRSLGWE